MTRIGILSDTHGHWDERYLKHFKQCDEIWHCGDIGTWEIAEKLAAFRPLRAVYGNIDGGDIRRSYPEMNRFTIEGTDVFIKHIGGYPGKYAKGKVISGLDAAAEQGAVVFHAGTAFKDEKIVSAGGRVLGVSALGKDIADAIANAMTKINLFISMSVSNDRYRVL